MTTNMLLSKIINIPRADHDGRHGAFIYKVLDNIYELGSDERSNMSVLTGTILYHPPETADIAVRRFLQTATAYDTAALIVFLFARADSYNPSNPHYKTIARCVARLPLHPNTIRAIVDIIYQIAEETEVEFPALRMAMACARIMIIGILQ
jgi:hypothetical protein